MTVTSFALIATKVQIPPRRAGGIARPRLVQRLEAGLNAGAKLSLVCAPAGYGKTSLVTEWLHRRAQDDAPPLQVAWVAVDESDDDLPHFLAYVAAALGRLAPDTRLDLPARLKSPQLPELDDLVDALIRDIATVAPPPQSDGNPPPTLVLILDDYHKLRNPTIHELAQRLVDQGPSTLHLLLITRTDPPLALSRLRVNGLLTEIRSRDLRCTLAETVEFLNHAMQLDLRTEWIEALAERTEGWIAGLHLAALSLRERAPEERAGFIQAFRGSHRYVFDYLAEEVIARQGGVVREFLTQTAPLERFNAALCNAVTGRTDGHRLLAQLEQANLFLIPLDDAREWYRYHHLFADYLRTGVAPATQADVSAKAATWCAAQGLAFEAMHYAAASGDPELAADLLEQLIQRAATWSGGAIATLVARLAAVPAATMHARPALSLNASRAFYLAGRPDLATQYLDQAEAALAAQDGRPDTARLSALAAVYRATLAAQAGDAPAALALVTPALHRLPAGDLHAQARAFDTLGLAYEVAGEPARAVEAYTRAAELAEAAGVVYLAVNARCEIALVRRACGDLAQVEAICRQALALSDTAIPPLGLAWSILGEVARERNDLDRADQHLRTGIELSRQGGLNEDLHWGLLFLARLHEAQADFPAAWQALTQVDAILRGVGVPRLARMAAANQARLQVVEGNAALAAAWAAQLDPLPAPRAAEPLRELEELTLARYYLATHAPARAHPVLAALTHDAQRAGRLRTVVEAQVLQALAAHQAGDTVRATRTLGDALRLASPLGLHRVFLDEGPALGPLLAAARTSAPTWVDALLETLAAPEHVEPSATPEPLSDQERKVLRLLCAGLSNQEIAAQLVIAPGTAKWHVHNVLQKLGVQRRAQAILRARALGLD